MGRLGSKHVKHVRGWLSSQQSHPEGCVKPAAPCLVSCLPAGTWPGRGGSGGRLDTGTPDPLGHLRVWSSRGQPASLDLSMGLQEVEGRLCSARPLWHVGGGGCHGWGSPLLLHLMHLEERGFWAAPRYQGVLLRARARPHGAAAQKVLWGSERSTMRIQHFK